MKGILKKLYKKSFVRNVAIVATGTAAAQAVTMAFTPIITRLYGPEAIGVLGVFMAMVLVVSPIAALNYPYGIVLPKSVSDAKGLIRLSLYISLGLAIISAIILALFNKSIVSLFQLEGIEPFLYLIPLIILFSGFLQVTRQWLFRTKQFRITAKVEFLKALVLNSSKVGIGWFYPVAAVLVILTTLGIAFQALLLLVGIKRSNLKHESKDNEESLKLKELAKKYRDFPLFRTPQAFIHSISNNLPVLY
ncbi:lipopolysaccharide biosynthesis protein [Thalassobacillus sp. C254]|uniref:lipopolysaccharide biosynthesis protein n=1 Tax=Thalassobacillus sp. C254 TaxID=1225341 RepID=UPI0006D14381|nr:oligosaccharide flippase family protein [Thalassobacillus sp. C254]